ncbi:PREDICTED: uncharacterized protein LOC105966270 [Erythranthe guttata]|uniref:uncharacterized protein LOC105966270 n=1 Tax=Erythranthe guttata TaxID=4155 RepID=UPI00064DDAB6|nr:PREDICTED: uncharacterized protein LOC105966270 [Erythranthe guttata]|eukprot:XP_012846292.1 PREDICTED: uncharacterized protein LOC105966270 [Erythranthe guttata]
MSWKKISSVNLYRDLDKVIQDMGLIKKDAMEIKDDNIGIIEDHLHINSSTLAGAASSRSPLTTKQETMVGFDELLIEVMDKLNAVDKYLNDHVFSLEAVFQLVNSRFIAITSDRDQNADFPSSINLLWNLQTLIVKERDAFAPFEIWKMTQLRHVQLNQLEMPDPPLDGKDEYVLGNLRTLSRIRNFK